MAATIIKMVVKRFLEPYLEGFSTKDMSLSFLMGKAALKDVEVNVAAVNQLLNMAPGTPVRFTRIHVSKLKVRASVRKIKTKPIRLQVDTVVLEMAEPSVIIPPRSGVTGVASPDSSSKPNEFDVEGLHRYALGDRIGDGISVAARRIILVVKTKGLLKDAPTGDWTPPTLIIEIGGLDLKSTDDQGRVYDLETLFRMANRKMKEILCYKRMTMESTKVRLVPAAAWAERMVAASKDRSSGKSAVPSPSLDELYSAPFPGEAVVMNQENPGPFTMSLTLRKRASDSILLGVLAKFEATRPVVLALVEPARCGSGLRNDGDRPKAHGLKLMLHFFTSFMQCLMRQGELAWFDSDVRRRLWQAVDEQQLQESGFVDEAVLESRFEDLCRDRAREKFDDKKISIDASEVNAEAEKRYREESAGDLGEDKGASIAMTKEDSFNQYAEIRRSSFRVIEDTDPTRESASSRSSFSVVDFNEEDAEVIADDADDSEDADVMNKNDDEEDDADEMQMLRMLNTVENSSSVGSTALQDASAALSATAQGDFTPETSQLQATQEPRVVVAIEIDALQIRIGDLQPVAGKATAESTESQRRGSTLVPAIGDILLITVNGLNLEIISNVHQLSSVISPNSEAENDISFRTSSASVVASPSLTSAADNASNEKDGYSPWRYVTPGCVLMDYAQVRLADLRIHLVNPLTGELAEALLHFEDTIPRPTSVPASTMAPSRAPGNTRRDPQCDDARRCATVPPLEGISYSSVRQSMATESAFVAADSLPPLPIRFIARGVERGFDPANDSAKRRRRKSRSSMVIPSNILAAASRAAATAKATVSSTVRGSTTSASDTSASVGDISTAAFRLNDGGGRVERSTYTLGIVAMTLKDQLSVPFPMVTNRALMDIPRRIVLGPLNASHLSALPALIAACIDERWITGHDWLIAQRHASGKAVPERTGSIEAANVRITRGGIQSHDSAISDIRESAFWEIYGRVEPMQQDLPQVLNVRLGGGIIVEISPPTEVPTLPGLRLSIDGFSLTRDHLSQARWSLPRAAVTKDETEDSRANTPLLLPQSIPKGSPSPLKGASSSDTSEQERRRLFCDGEEHVEDLLQPLDYAAASLLLPNRWNGVLQGVKLTATELSPRRYGFYGGLPTGHIGEMSNHDVTIPYLPTLKNLDLFAVKSLAFGLSIDDVTAQSLESLYLSHSASPPLPTSPPQPPVAPKTRPRRHTRSLSITELLNQSFVSDVQKVANEDPIPASSPTPKHAADCFVRSGLDAAYATPGVVDHGVLSISFDICGIATVADFPAAAAISQLAIHGAKTICMALSPSNVLDTLASQSCTGNDEITSGSILDEEPFVPLSNSADTEKGDRNPTPFPLLTIAAQGRISQVALVVPVPQFGDANDTAQGSYIDEAPMAVELVAGVEEIKLQAALTIPVAPAGTQDEWNVNGLRQQIAIGPLEPSANDCINVANSHFNFCSSTISGVSLASVPTGEAAHPESSKIKDNCADENDCVLILYVNALAGIAELRDSRIDGEYDVQTHPTIAIHMNISAESQDQPKDPSSVALNTFPSIWLQADMTILRQVVDRLATALARARIPIAAIDRSGHFSESSSLEDIATLREFLEDPSHFFSLEVSEAVDFSARTLASNPSSSVANAKSCSRNDESQKSSQTTDESIMAILPVFGVTLGCDCDSILVVVPTGEKFPGSHSSSELSLRLDDLTLTAHIDPHSVSSAAIQTSSHERDASKQSIVAQENPMHTSHTQVSLRDALQATGLTSLVKNTELRPPATRALSRSVVTFAEVTDVKVIQEDATRRASCTRCGNASLKCSPSLWLKTIDKSTAASLEGDKATLVFGKDTTIPLLPRTEINAIVKLEDASKPPLDAIAIDFSFGGSPDDAELRSQLSRKVTSLTGSLPVGSAAILLNTTVAQAEAVESMQKVLVREGWVDTQHSKHLYQAPTTNDDSQILREGEGNCQDSQDSSKVYHYSVLPSSTSVAEDFTALGRSMLEVRRLACGIADESTTLSLPSPSISTAAQQLERTLLTTQSLQERMNKVMRLQQEQLSRSENAASTARSAAEAEAHSLRYKLVERDRRIAQLQESSSAEKQKTKKLQSELQKLRDKAEADAATAATTISMLQEQLRQATASAIEPESIRASRGAVSEIPQHTRAYREMKQTRKMPRTWFFRKTSGQ